MDYRMDKKLTSLSIAPYDVGQAGAVIGWNRGDCNGDSAAFAWTKGSEPIYSQVEMENLGLGWWF